jgi:iron only hydrogenase large subunit-like protein
VKFCNDASEEHIAIRPELCIGCGTCIDACTHGAREGIDDFDGFMKAVSAGAQVVAIVAPAVAANFPGEYLRLNGWLKSLGVKAIFDVSFGAELTVKSYLEAIKTKGPKCVSAQPCAALVSFIEIYHPELIEHLAPADSPMMHTMKMVRKFYPAFSSAKFAIISPCYAKRREFDEVGVGDFNVTYRSIDAYLKSKGTQLSKHQEVEYDNPPAERAVLFSTPGGLLRTAVREAPAIQKRARKIEGVPFVYHYLSGLKESISKNRSPLLVDCLSCEMGCNGGPGTMNRKKSPDEIEDLIESRSNLAQTRYAKKGILRMSRARLRKFVNKYWEKGLYDRTYVNRSASYRAIRVPSAAELKAIYEETYKTKPEHFLNCSSCGYNDCEQMAIAIYNKLNRPENCRHYKEIALNMTAMKKIDTEIGTTAVNVDQKMDEAMANASSVAKAAEMLSTSANSLARSTIEAR